MKILPVYILLLVLVLCALVLQTEARSTLAITPVPGRHSEVRTPFFFYVKDTPSQIGWRAAEFKDEGGVSYYKTDAVPGCAEWVVAPGTWPGLVLTPGGANCTGFAISFGMLYWFDVPPISVTPSPVGPPPASVTPSPPFEATATPTARVTPIPPSPPGGGIPTLSPAQHAAFTVRCDFSGDEFTMTIWGSYGLVYSVPGEWCSEVDRGAQSLLERMAQATPSRVEVRP